MMGVMPQDPDQSEFVEVDPTGRYGRYNEILGKGASKIVYRAFDEYEGIEVAWNQVKLHDFLQSPEDLERLYCEIHLLKTLKHKNIMKFYTSWVDTSKRNINFITEMFTSGTLRQYRQKHRRVNIRAVKHWCRQILNGLLYLHSHDPPVIHRDLKCDNIFVNGNQGVVKIGDLGLAAILRKSHAAHCVGTPEFMAPEVYEEEYNELVDIYSFGMCVLEMVTFEYPYSECTHPAQIYKKVISGSMPEALYKLKDPEVRQFIEKCLATAPERLSARELLRDPFLQVEEHVSGCVEGDIYQMGGVLRQSSLNLLHSNGSLLSNGFSDDVGHVAEFENDYDYDAADIEIHGIELFDNQEDEPLPNVDITIKGRRNDDGRIFLRLRIADRDGRVRNIYFPFDIEADTALSVATEMVAELDITDYEVTRIADMIDCEVSSLVPEWKPGPGIEDVPGNLITAFCQNCASNVSSCGSLLDYLSLKNPGTGSMKSVHCLECASTHGRFEEITYRAEGSEQGEAAGAAMLSTSQSDGLDLCSHASEGSHSDVESAKLNQAKDKREPCVNSHVDTSRRISDDKLHSTSAQQQCSEMPELRHQEALPIVNDDYENEMRQELRWIKAKYQMELREYEHQQLSGLRKVLHPSPDFSNREFMVENGVPDTMDRGPLAAKHRRIKSFHLGTNFSYPIPTVDMNACLADYHCPVDTNGRYCSSSRPDSEAQRARHCEANCGSSPESLFTARSLYIDGIHRPIVRTKSLLVDAVDV